jgi:hypothetical protein
MHTIHKLLFLPKLPYIGKIWYLFMPQLVSWDIVARNSSHLFITEVHAWRPGTAITSLGQNMTGEISIREVKWLFKK